MTLVPTAILLALGQMASPAFLRVIGLGVLLAAALLAALALVFGAALGAMIPQVLDLPFDGAGAALLAMGGMGALLAASVFVMVPVASLFMGLMLDHIARAVEARHYPGLPPARPQPLYAGLRAGFNFLGLVIAVNAVALLLYALSGPFAPLMFWAVNGYLIGREYFAQAALRRHPPDAARALRRAHSGQIWLAGICMAIPLSLPGLNLLTPVLAAATFTHLAQRLAERASVPPPPLPWAR